VFVPAAIAALRLRNLSALPLPAPRQPRTRRQHRCAITRPEVDENGGRIGPLHLAVAGSGWRSHQNSREREARKRPGSSRDRRTARKKAPSHPAPTTISHLGLAPRRAGDPPRSCRGSGRHESPHHCHGFVLRAEASDNRRRRPAHPSVKPLDSVQVGRGPMPYAQYRARTGNGRSWT